MQVHTVATLLWEQETPQDTAESAVTQLVYITNCTYGEGTVYRTKERLYVYLKGHRDRFHPFFLLKDFSAANDLATFKVHSFFTPDFFIYGFLDLWCTWYALMLVMALVLLAGMHSLQAKLECMWSYLNMYLVREAPHCLGVLFYTCTVESFCGRVAMSL